MLIKSYLY